MGKSLLDQVKDNKKQPKKEAPQPDDDDIFGDVEEVTPEVVKNPTIKKEVETAPPKSKKEEKFEITPVESFGDIQSFDEFQYIPSKRAIAEALDMYRYLTKSIIKDSDFHYIGDGRYLKRSGFRKIAQAFGITLEQIGKEEFYEVNGEKHCRVKVRAFLGHVDHKAIEIGMKLLIDSGKINVDEVSRLLINLSKMRYADGVGIVGMSEIKFGKNQTEHNLMGFAYTRGASRAIADLVGFGVVSATEVDVNEDMEDWLS